MSTDSIPSNCPELGVEVPIASIEKELHKLWEQDEAQTNASLMNLAVYSERCGGLLENSKILRELTREHACRALLIEIDRSVTDPSLRAWITAHCHLAEGRKSVCCEQVAFRLTGRVTGRFRNTVFAHLNSDLPLVFHPRHNSPGFYDSVLSQVYGTATPNIVRTEPNEERMLLAVSEGAGLTLLLADRTATLRFSGVVYRRFIDPEPVGMLAVESPP